MPEYSTINSIIVHSEHILFFWVNSLCKYNSYNVRRMMNSSQNLLLKPELQRTHWNFYQLLVNRHIWFQKHEYFLSLHKNSWYQYTPQILHFITQRQAEWRRNKTAQHPAPTTKIKLTNISNKLKITEILAVLFLLSTIYTYNLPNKINCHFVSKRNVFRAIMAVFVRWTDQEADSKSTPNDG